MSVGFDWEQEDEKRRTRQLGDEHYLELQQLKKRRARTAIVCFLAVPAVMALIIYGRGKVADEAIHEDFDRTVSDEIRSLRVGDKGAFLGFQQNVKPWFGVQWDAYDAYQRDRSHVVPGNQVLSSQNDDLHGQAVLEELVNGTPYQVTWYYDYSEHDGWKQVTPPLSAFGVEKQLTDDHFTATYRSLDDPQVAGIKADLDAWWQTACQLTACQTGGPAPFTIHILPDVTVKPVWSADDPSVMELPSPQLGRIPSDGRLDPEYEHALARLFGEYWARWVTPVSADSTADAAWFHAELATYLAHAMGVQENAPMLGPLTQQSGPTAVMALAGKLQAGEGAIPALREISGAEPLQGSYDWGVYVATRLRAEAALMASGKPEAAAKLYDDPDHPGSPDILDGASPGSILVEGLDQSGGLYWARITFTQATLASSDGNAPLVAAYIPFRIVGDRWSRTSAQPADFGTVSPFTTTHVTLNVSQLDTALLGDLPNDLESGYLKASSDLGIKPGEISGLDVTVLPSAVDDDPRNVAVPLPFDPGGANFSLPIHVTSPHLTARLASQSARDALRGQILRSMVIQMVRYRAYTLDSRAPLLLAIERWELARLGFDANTLLPLAPWLSGQDGGDMAQLWAHSHGGPFTLEDQLRAQALVELLTRQHGPEAVGALLAHIADAGTIDDWLQASLKVSAEDIRVEWASAAAVAVSSYGGQLSPTAGLAPSSQPTQVAPDGVIDVMMNDNGKTISLKVGQSIRLNLSPNPDEFWSVKVADEGVLSLAHHVDSNTGAQWVYTASKAGRTSVTATGTFVCKLNPGASCDGISAPWENLEWEIVVQ